MKEGLREIDKKGVGDITLYTLPHCNYCQILKGALDKLEIPYTNIDVEVNELMGDWLEENLKTESYPIIYYKRTPEEYIYILSQTDLETLNGIRIFNTIEEALEILLEFYYEI